MNSLRAVSVTDGLDFLRGRFAVDFLALPLADAFGLVVFLVVALALLDLGLLDLAVLDLGLLDLAVLDLGLLDLGLLDLAVLASLPPLLFFLRAVLARVAESSSGSDWSLMDAPLQTK